VSAHRRRPAGPDPTPPDPARALDLWWQAVDLRTEWLGHALRTAPADRAAAEDAITGLYALLGAPPPAFVWVPSPSAGAQLVPPGPQPVSDGPWPLESRLASAVSALRDRLDHRVRAGRRWTARPAPPDPAAALRRGSDLRLIVEAGVYGALNRAVRDAVAGPTRAAVADRLGLVWYGQHEVDWLAGYDVHRRVLGTRFDPADVTHLELWGQLARSAGWWWPRDGVCVVAERPTRLGTEPAPDDGCGEVRLHAAEGPAVLFDDGWAVHSWHGTRVPAWVIDDPTVERIAAERNVEVRRCAIERIGWASFVDGAGLALVARSGDPANPGCELRLYDLPGQHWGPQTRLLLAVNGTVERDGTRRRYGLRVPSVFDDPVDAAGWSYGLTGAQYRQLQRRT
jgi:hypothetical protein